MTFEDFASQVFSPSPGYPMSGTGEKWTTPWFGIMFFSTPSLYLPYLSVHFIVASPHLCTFFFLFSCPFLRASLSSSSTPVCSLYLLYGARLVSTLPPRLRSLMNIKRGAGSSCYPTDFKRSAFSTSSSLTHATWFISSCFKLHLSVQLLSYEYKQPC